MPCSSLALRPSPSLRQQLGCWVNERWKTELALLPPCFVDWLELCNRREVIELDEVSGGRICMWRDSSQLTVSRIFPGVGSRLLRKCLQRWPMSFNFAERRLCSDQPEASVLLAIGGTDRIRQFHTVLASLRGQTHDAMEIIVVEQSETAELQCEVPRDIRYFHTPKSPDVGFNKSWALNVAARHARGRFLLIHDADYMVPRDYVSACCRVLKTVDGVRPSRFNFHLDQSTTVALTDTRALPRHPSLEYVVQNNPTPLGVRRDVYWAIGGHDESFVGWGGEDVEFVSRLRTRAVSEGGWIPIIHLWHPSAKKKVTGHRNQQLQIARLSVPVQARIQQLSRHELGQAMPNPLSAIQ